jgi:hypothetical protein
MLSLKDALQDGASYWISPGGELILVGDGFHEELAKSLREFLLATGIEIDEGEGQPGDPDSPIFPNAHPQEMYGRYKYMFEHGWVRLRGSDGSLQIHSYFENISRLSDYLGEMIDTQQRASSGFVGSNGIRIRVGIVNPDPYLTDTYGEKWTELYYGQFVMVGDIAKATVKKSRGLLNPYRFRSFKPFYRR